VTGGSTYSSEKDESDKLKPNLAEVHSSGNMRLRHGVLALLFLLLPAEARAVIDETAFRPYDGKSIVSIAFTGNNATRDFVIEREIGLAVGDTFSTSKLAEGVQNLENLGIFGSIVPVIEEKPEGVALEYQFREMPPFIPYIAFQYTEENGFSIGPALSSVNLFGRAIKVSGRALVGGTTTFSLKVKHPWIAGDRHLGLDLAATHLIRNDELNEFEETSDEITPWIKRYIGESGRMRVMAGYFRMAADRDGITLAQDRTDQFFRFGAAVGLDTRDSWRNPSRGWENEIELLGTFGDGDFGTATIDIRRFQPLNEKHTLFVGALTSLQSGTVGEDVPKYLQYRLGGANSIRGQGFSLGKTLYGKNQLIATVEYQIGVLPLKPYNFFKWSAAIGMQLALFTDAGVAWSTPDEFSAHRAKMGFGIGLHLLVPGSEMVRLDLGFNAQGDAQFHFSSSFKWTAQRPRVR
jgi:outer membrane protein insertion porin family